MSKSTTTGRTWHDIVAAAQPAKAKTPIVAVTPDRSQRRAKARGQARYAARVRLINRKAFVRAALAAGWAKR